MPTPRPAMARGLMPLSLTPMSSAQRPSSSMATMAWWKMGEWVYVAVLKEVWRRCWLSMRSKRFVHHDFGLK